MKKHLALVSLALLVFCNGISQAAERSNEPVVTLGKDHYRNHFYSSGLPTALCRQRVIQVGETLGQPLIVPVGGAGTGTVFHIGRTSLFVLSPDGEIVRTTAVQDKRSWGYITYAMDGHEPDPARDLLYVATGDPGLKVFQVQDLLAHQDAKPLGEISFPVQGVVSAPLVLSRDLLGRDRVVISLVPDQVKLISNLALGQPQEFDVMIPGWNSGTALQFDRNMSICLRHYRSEFRVR